MRKLAGMIAEVLPHEFPFVKDLPKREKTKLAKLMDTFNEARALVETRGMLVPLAFASKIVGVSRQRIDELCGAGKLERVYLGEQPFVTEASLIEWARSERKTGRPVKTPEGIREIWKAARESAQGK